MLPIFIYGTVGRLSGALLLSAAVAVFTLRRAYRSNES